VSAPRPHLRLVQGGGPPADLYGPFAAAAEALREASVEALARTGRRVEVSEPGELLASAASRMGWRKVGALAVIDGGRLVGSLSEDDLLRATARRLEERVALVEKEGDALVLWQALLDGLRVGEVMTPRAELPVVATGAPLLDGLTQVCGATRDGTRFRYLWVVDAEEAVQRVVSIRDVARSLTRVYDGDFPVEGFSSPAYYEQARGAVAQVLDLPIGAIRERLALGHSPSVLRVDASGEETVGRMWGDRRGYVLATLADGAPLGICTRRDLLRGLRNRYADLGGLRFARLMSGNVKTVDDTNTLCGVFKLMAIEGCRHMPVVDATDRVVRMISMWEGVSLFAPRRGAAS
jgi:CBS domain-containing protein